MGVRRFREQKDIRFECEGLASARPQGMHVLETKEDLMKDFTDLLILGSGDCNLEKAVRNNRSH